MHAKKAARMRRSKKVRAQMRNLQAHRLCINRTPRHIYAQVISPDGDRTIVSASTTEADISKETGSGGNISAAAVVGRAIAERAKAKGVTSVAFDRSGFKYHGRIKALADAARENGLEF